MSDLFLSAAAVINGEHHEACFRSMKAVRLTLLVALVGPSYSVEIAHVADKATVSLGGSSLSKCFIV